MAAISAQEAELEEGPKKSANIAQGVTMSNTVIMLVNLNDCDSETRN